MTVMVDSVQLSVGLSPELHVQYSPNFCTGNLRRRCDTLCTSGFMDDSDIIYLFI